MPELPEVETVKAGLENAVLGKRIQSVKINRYDLRVPIPQDFGQMMSGRPIQHIERRGKYIIFHIDDVRAVLHLGMSGRIRIFDSLEAYEARKHDHVICTMEGGGCFAFEDPRRFGMFYLARDKDWQSEKPFSAMGPEPLSTWSGADLYEAIHHKKTIIKTALLDQRVVAGLGNIYVCEALYSAHVLPTRLCHTITRSEADAIVKESRAVLSRAIDAGGSTLKDYQKTDGSLGYFQYSFSVYDQEDQDCANKSCGAKILRIVQAGRSTFYCPKCQK